mgnify:CR=1 FL=1
MIATGSVDRTVRVWSTKHGHCTHVLRGHKTLVSRVVFHPDVKRLVTDGRGDIPFHVCFFLCVSLAVIGL